MAVNWFRCDRLAEPVLMGEPEIMRNLSGDRVWKTIFYKVSSRHERLSPTVDDTPVFSPYPSDMSLYWFWGRSTVAILAVVILITLIRLQAMEPNKPAHPTAGNVPI
jgi:hypothetical protein